MSAQLIVCGSSGSHPGPDAAGASLLLSVDGTDVLLDIGNGSLTNLMRFRDVADIDAIVLSHMHPDHFLDLYGFHHARVFHPTPDLPPVPVHAPRGAAETVALLVDDTVRLHAGLPFHDLVTDRPFHVARLRFVPFGVSHPVPAFGVRVEAGATDMAYTGDTELTDDLVAHVRGADLLVADATWLEDHGPYPAGIHMTAADVGRLADAAKVGKVLLTHIKPTHDHEASAAEAARHFGGEILVARDRLELDL